MFLEFTKNTNICSFIKRIIDENDGIVAGNSYIVISNNNEILNNIATWIIFELTDINSNLMICCNNFEFTKLATDIEKLQRMYVKNEEGGLLPIEQTMGDIYYDIVRLNTGHVFPSEVDEQKANAYINNRMVDLMERYRKPKGMILLTSKPIPFFIKQAENIEKLHIIDLRNITSLSDETVEME